LKKPIIKKGWWNGSKYRPLSSNSSTAKKKKKFEQFLKSVHPQPKKVIRFIRFWRPAPSNISKTVIPVFLLTVPETSKSRNIFQ
jgi:hypothetical protein